MFFVFLNKDLNLPVRKRHVHYCWTCLAPMHEPFPWYHIWKPSAVSTNGCTLPTPARIYVDQTDICSCQQRFKRSPNRSASWHMARKLSIWRTRLTDAGLCKQCVRLKLAAERAAIQIQNLFAYHVELQFRNSGTRAGALIISQHRPPCQKKKCSFTK